MILRLKNWRINNGNLLVEEVNNRKIDIIEMFRLVDEDLSDDEFLKIISTMYDWDKRDIESVIQAMFNTTKIYSGEIISNIPSFPQFLYSNDFYYNSMLVASNKKIKTYKSSSGKKNERYSMGSIMRMVENKELVLTQTNGVGDVYSWPTDEYGRRSAQDTVRIMFADDASKQKLQELESYNINKVTLSNLGGYKAWLLPLFRSLFTPERIEHDILQAINISKEAFEIYELLYAKGNGTLNAALEETKFLQELNGDQEIPLGLPNH